MGESEHTSSRRPLKSRNLVVFQSMASWMAKRGISPNAISISSLAFSIVAGGALFATAGAEGGLVRLWWLAAAALPISVEATMPGRGVAAELGAAATGAGPGVWVGGIAASAAVRVACTSGPGVGSGFRPHEIDSTSPRAAAAASVLNRVISSRQKGRIGLWTILPWAAAPQTPRY